MASIAYAAALLTLAGFATRIQAQEEWAVRSETYGSIGNGRLNQGENDWGNGQQFGSEFGVRPFEGALRGLGLESRVCYTRLMNKPNAMSSLEGNSTSFSLGALWHFSDSRVQPFVQAEIGKTTAHLIARGASLQREDWGQQRAAMWTRRDGTSQLSSGAGVGLKIRIFQNFFLRPEVRYDTPGAGAGWNSVTLRLSMGYGSSL